MLAVMALFFLQSKRFAQNKQRLWAKWGGARLRLCGEMGSEAFSIFAKKEILALMEKQYYLCLTQNLWPMTANDVFDKIQHLPTEVQQHLFLYVDFLYSTYNKQGEGAFFQAHELTAAGKALLEQRLAAANAHPEKQKDWREARKQIHEKHKLPQ
jgi:hypothetical protein